MGGRGRVGYGFIWVWGLCVNVCDGEVSLFKRWYDYLVYLSDVWVFWL